MTKPVTIKVQIYNAESSNSEDDNLTLIQRHFSVNWAGSLGDVFFFPPLKIGR